MDTDSTLPAKRLRGSLNGNVQLTECIRQFKLPRQYPSMVPKLNDTTLIATKIIRNKETSLNNVRTIQLKAKDGRDLGKVNLRDLPQNIQGKTITIARNDIVKKPISVNYKTEDIATGILPPVSILKTTDTARTKVESTLLSMMTVAKNSKEHIAKVSRDDDVVKGLPLPTETKTISGSHSEARPQVLVFQSGKTWHMVKIPRNMQSKQSNNEIDKSMCMAKWPKNLTNDKTSLVHSPKEQQSDNITTVIGSKRVSDNSVVLFNKTPSLQNRTDTKQQSQLWRNWPTEGSKSNFLANVVSTETTKPNIKISGVSGSSNAGSESIAGSDTHALKNLSLIRREAVIAFPEGLAKDCTSANVNNHAKPTANGELTERTKTTASAEVTTLGQRSTRRKKLLVNKNNDATKYSASRDITSTRQAEKRTLGYGEKKNEIANLSILEKALSTVEDEVLREKALKVLADCGIGIERRVPIRPPADTKLVKDSDTQTSIFGLWETEKFIHVSEDNPGIRRLQMTERSRDQSPNTVIGNPNSQELYLNHLDVPNSECVELTNMVEKYVEGCDTAAEVANIFAPPSPISYKVIEQLEKDFNTCKEYDDNGLLNIHRAVTTDNAQAVQRHLMVLRCCEESADIPTRDGQTSLELAIRYEASPEIITLLLNAGAEPTSTDTAHDSALIIACRRSLPIMKELISRVKTPTALDNCDSTGFTALHYCTQSGYHEGVEALVNASADVNSRDRRSGRTPLFHAVENEHYNIAEMLLKNGADANISNYGGYTIYNIIDESKHYNLLEMLNRAITNR